MAQQPSSYREKQYQLTTKNLFSHFLLVHDFLFKFTKTKANNAQYFDTQLDVQEIMNNATLYGGRFGQSGTLVSLVFYCLKSKNIPMKFAMGFLYVYWTNHFYTLGSYFGALIRMPTAYRKIGLYYEQSNEPHPNLLDTFEQIMESNEDYSDTHRVLETIYPETKAKEGQLYIQNDFFVKNKDKYFPESPQSETGAHLKLPVLDSFLTRYLYHSFTRWFHRVNLFLGLRSQ